MSDEADQAQHAERLFLVAALAAVGGRSALPGREGTACVDCGEDIDPRRVAAMPGCLRCRGCQEEHERGPDGR